MKAPIKSFKIQMDRYTIEGFAVKLIFLWGLWAHLKINAALFVKYL